MIKTTMTMMPMSKLLLLVLALAISSMTTTTNRVFFVTARGTFYNDGFIEEIVASQRAMTGAFITNPQPGPHQGKPMLLISSKRGNVHAMPDPDNDMDNMIEIMNIEELMCTNGERGMQSMAPHPNFGIDDNYYIYIYYTAFQTGCAEDEEGMFGPNNRLSRFTMDPDTLQIDSDTEEILLEGAPTYKFYHNGGAMKFGNDGKLYVTTGDGGGDAFGTSQDLTNLHGVLMRLNDDGTIPNDNPFTIQGGYADSVPCGQSKGQVPSGSSTDAVCSEIFSYGLRNPFRIVMDPKETTKTSFYINDVGGAVWEEISEGGTDYAGKNYGWPRYEGPCRFGSTTDCPLYDSNAVIPNVDTIVKPLYYYEHRATNEGGCVSGGAFVPEGIWPAEYDFLYADFIFQGIYNLVEAPEQECSECVPPIPAYVNDTFYTSIKDDDQHENFARIVDMFFGPYNGTQALYIFKMGGGDNIWRIRYTGNLNIPPVAVITVNQTTVDVGQIVAFDASQSSDVDDTDLKYEWDFDNGDFSTEQNPIYVYTQPGQYTVRLSVTDPTGQEQQDSQLIKVGTPPTLNITSPLDGKEFFVGEILTLSGVAYNATGGRLDDLSISWEVRKHHADHWHPFLDPDTTGNNLQLFPAPEPEDYLAATNSYLEIIMTATDSNGIQSTTTREVYPRIVKMCIDSEPQGLEIYVDEYPITTPMRITSWINHDLRLRTVSSQETLFGESQQTVLFSAWSDSVATEDREIRLRPDSTLGVVATFCGEDNTTCVETARAADTITVARCLSEAPSAAPSSSPTISLTGEIEEDFPVDNANMTNMTDPSSNTTMGDMFGPDDEIVADDGQSGGIGDPMHDNESPPDEDSNIWDIFDDDDNVVNVDDSAAVGVMGSPVAAMWVLLFAVAAVINR